MQPTTLSPEMFRKMIFDLCEESRQELDRTQRIHERLRHEKTPRR